MSYSPPPPGPGDPLPAGSQGSLQQPNVISPNRETPANHPIGVPRRKQPPSPSHDGARFSKGPTSPVRISYSSQDFPPRASSAQVFNAGSTLNSVSHSPSPASDREYQGLGSERPFTEPPPERHSSVLQPPSDVHALESPRPSQSAAFVSHEDGRDPDFSIYDQYYNGDRYNSRHSSTGSIEQGMRAVRLGPQLQYQHSHLSGEFTRKGPDNGDSGEVVPSVRSESPASSLGGENMTTSKRLLAPISHSNSRQSMSQSPSQSRDGTRGRAHSPMSGYGSPSLGRPASVHSGHSPDSRPTSYVDLLNIPYPQVPAGGASFSNSHLRDAIGSNASLLSHKQTLEMYRANAKKTNDSSVLYEFALFMVNTAKQAGYTGTEDENSPPRKKLSSKVHRDLESPYVDNSDPETNPGELVREARQILQRLADRAYPFAQYLLGDGYASGFFNRGKEDYAKAFPLFLAASKHGHAEAGFRAALCYEHGWGSRKDPAKAVQFYRQAASKNHPGAMLRLAKACLIGDLGMGVRYREGVKWLKRASETADSLFNEAPYELGLLHEHGYGDDVFQDEVYAAQLFTIAAELGHAEANYRLGDAYEHGKLSCPRDPALSVHFYNGAAQKGHVLAMMALCAWYMVGAEPVLEKDENEAYEWARKAAELGLAKAQYAVGYFTEMGIGCRRDPLEANVWYVKAADQGDERAKHRLATIRAAASGEPDTIGSGRTRLKQNGKDEKDCIVM